jgi:hypothetical protein
VWAAAILGWYSQGFFSGAAAALLEAMSVRGRVDPQSLSNALLACAACAHWDSHVQQLLNWIAGQSLTGFTPQHLANFLHAWAVLTCIAHKAGLDQQQLQQLGQVADALFKEAEGRWAQDHTVFEQKHLRQLFQAHLYAAHLGLPQQLEGGLLDQARAAWGTGSQTISDGQKEVARALRQLGYTTQLEALSLDGLMRADIVITALPDGSPCRIALEFDGPSHYVTEYTASGDVIDRLNGPTRLRNVLLQARFSDGLVCICGREWGPATKGGQQEEYLRKVLEADMKQEVRYMWNNQG